MATRFYLLNQVAPYTPPTIRGAWSQTTSAIVKAMSTTKAIDGGNAATIAIAETSVTNPFDVLLGRWVSGPLAAQTLSGTVNLTLAIQESNVLALDNWHVHIYVTSGDTDTPRGTILTDYTEGAGVNVWPTTQTFKQLNAAQTLTNLAINDGDRLVIELGYTARNTSATSFNGSITYGVVNTNTHAVMSTDAANGTTGASTTQAGHIDFSATFTESATPTVRLSQLPIEIVESGTTNTTKARLSQMVIEVLTENIATVADPPGGGSPSSGSDPSADSSLCGVNDIVTWLTLETDSGQKTYATVDLGIDTTYREGRILQMGPIDRAISDITKRMETGTCSVTLSDTDKALRTLASSGTLLNKRVNIYCASSAQIRAASTPRRLASMIIRDYHPENNLTFVLELKDYFTSLIQETLSETKIPQRAFATFDAANDFPYLPDGLIGKAIPVYYGLNSDEASGVAAVGVVPTYYVGPRRLSDGNDWDEYVVCGHACKLIQSWFASDLGATPTRVKMSTTTEGVDFLIPGFTNWNSIVGANPYVVYNSNRYTVIYCKGNRSTAAKNGTIPIVLNLGGIEDVGDGSGTMIDSGARITEHVINNWILNNYRNGAWFANPTFNGYSLIRTSSFETCKTASAVRISGGYLGAFGLGWDGNTKSAEQVIFQMCQDFDIDIFCNRHGQVTGSMTDASAAVVKTFVDLTDIVANSFSARRRIDEMVNASLFRYKRRYASTATSIGPVGTGASEWLIDGQWYSDAGSQTAHGEKRTNDLSFESLRDTATANDVAQQAQTRRLYGPVYATFTTNLCGTDCELGDNIKITHFAGVAAGGWSNKAFRVVRMKVNPVKGTVEFDAYDLDWSVGA